MSIKGIVVGVISGLATLIIALLLLGDPSPDKPAFLIAFIPAFGAVWAGYKLTAKSTDRTMVDVAVGTSKSVRETVHTVKQKSHREESYDAYAIAEQEVENETYEKGLWSKALVDADGNKEKRPLVYMKLRAAQLQRQARKEE